MPRNKKYIQKWNNVNTVTENKPPFWKVRKYLKHCEKVREDQLGIELVVKDVAGLNPKIYSHVDVPIDKRVI